MIYVLLWLVFGIIGAMVGGNKGKAGLGIFLGVLLGPIGVLIIFLVKGDRKTCPYCKGFVHPEATRCPHCHKELPQETEGEAAADSVTIGATLDIETRKTLLIVGVLFFVVIVSVAFLTH